MSGRPVVTLVCLARDDAKPKKVCADWATHTSWLGPRCDVHAAELTSFLRNPPEWYRRFDRGPMTDEEIDDAVQRIAERPSPT
jgi:hypothetical protein